MVGSSATRETGRRGRATRVYLAGMSLFRTKSVEQSIAETEEPEHRLKKNLGALDLTIFGVGVIIGAGIFVYTGLVAATNAGPAISVSFLIAGLVFLSMAILGAIALITDYLFDSVAVWILPLMVAVALVVTWFLRPLLRGEKSSGP